MSLRILMVGACPFPAPQGSQILMQDTASALRRAGHKVTLLVYGYGSQSVSSNEEGLLRSARIPGMRRVAAGPSWGKPFADFAMTIKLRNILKSERFDILHAHNYEGLLVALTAGAKIPIVYHAHNAMGDELPYYFRWKAIASYFGGFLDRFLPRRADGVIALHDRLAQYLTTCGCQPEKITVIPPPCDADAFQSVPEEPHHGATPAVLYTGNLDAYQNLPLLAEVMQRVRKKLPGVTLHVASPENIPVPFADYTHFTPDLPSLLEVFNLDCVIACPRIAWSGYPIKLLNTMAAARPVVACRSVSYPLTHLENGYIVADNDVDAFAEGLLLLLRNTRLRRKLGKNARTTIRYRHSFDAYAAALTTLYRRLLETKQGKSGS
ncbi:MAG TPA: glycosyltransferase family 4 protein [Candidatus Hydrogenedentes bacterium]|nr:glycosyltransferase family 4 protein [Candidatus Hydrogenedentota bacterium]HOL76307.1 glycosyltransferase family 4 protein [Candidatus Hydrogenedentota bacterium]HPO86135.1 glycosyltransferase family 4 protein [Candidatus Hydrogenedentota bacterium]